MRFLIFLLILSFSSCDNFHRNGVGNVEPVVIRDTIYKTVYLEPEKSRAQIYVDTLRRYLGTREATGNNDGAVVEMFLEATCGFKNAPYCAAFLSYGLIQIDCEIPELSCYTPSFFPSDRVVWKRGDSGEIAHGDIFGLYFKSKGRIAHVGVVVEDLGDGWLVCLEANTNQEGSREGDGIYIRLRHKSQIYKVSRWVC